MLVIRLARRGRKKQPIYRMVVQEKDWAPSSKAIENVGHVNPHTDPQTITLKDERIKYWISQGAQPSATVHNMLVEAGIITGDKQRVVYGKPVEKEEEESSTAEAPKEKPAEEKSEDQPEESKEEPAEKNEE